MEAAQTHFVTVEDDIEETEEVAQQLTVIVKDDSESPETILMAMAAQTEKKELEAQPKRVYEQYSWQTYSPSARLVYIRDVETAETELAQFKPGLTGFDMEWRPCYRKGQPENPVALVQLANEETVLLLQISAMRSTSPLEFPSTQR